MAGASRWMGAAINISAEGGGERWRCRTSSSDPWQGPVIRALWVAMATAFATLFFGLIAIIGSVLRIRGRLYFWATQQWSRAILRASAVRVIPHGMDRLDWSE